MASSSAIQSLLSSSFTGCVRSRSLNAWTFCTIAKALCPPIYQWYHPLHIPGVTPLSQSISTSLEEDTNCCVQNLPSTELGKDGGANRKEQSIVVWPFARQEHFISSRKQAYIQRQKPRRNPSISHGRLVSSHRVLIKQRFTLIVSARVAIREAWMNDFHSLLHHRNRPPEIMHKVFKVIVVQVTELMQIYEFREGTNSIAELFTQRQYTRTFFFVEWRKPIEELSILCQRIQVGIHFDTEWNFT